VGLAGAGLAVGENGAVVAFDDLEDDRLDDLVVDL